MALPSDPKARKERPIGTGVIDYFPDALAEVAHVSFVGNEQHNPGTSLHWDRSKSQDEADALMRHFVERGKVDTDGVRHSAKMAWRALALLQKEIEQAQWNASAQQVCVTGMGGAGGYPGNIIGPTPASDLVTTARGGMKL